jgi:transposase
MIPHGVPIFVATETIDMRLGFERLGGLVREWMAQEPRQRALFVFIGKRRVSMKILS